MKIIIVSNPNAVEKEANTINALFDEGLELFHIRKPDSSENELIELIEKINTQHQSKIVLHQYHQLVERFKTNRIHFPESERLKLKEVWIIIKQNGLKQLGDDIMNRYVYIDGRSCLLISSINLFE